LACLKIEEIPVEVDLSDDLLLKGMDITDVRSLNGKHK
jgi:poly(A) polymerase Pap1